MKLVNKSILLISPEAWGDTYVSKHHYANELVRRENKVFYLNPPSTHFECHTSETQVEVVDYSPLLKGLRFLPSAISAYLTHLEVKKLEARLSSQFDIIWNFDSSRFFNLKAVSKNTLKICHLVDLNQNLQRPLLAKTSDFCFGTTRYIVDELKKHNDRSYKVGHAYQPPEKHYPEFTFVMPGTNKNKALYVGNLSMKYIDWQILLESAKAYPELDFIFVGPDGNSNLSRQQIRNEYKEALKALPNAFFCPPIHSKYISQLLQYADILLIAYQEKYHKDQAAPHKMVEYLASGKPIVATYTGEYEHHDERLFMSIKNADYCQQIAFAVGFQQGVQSIKRVTTYSQSVDIIEGLINKAYK